MPPAWLDALYRPAASFALVLVGLVVSISVVVWWTTRRDSDDD